MLRVRWFAFPMVLVPTLVHAEATVSLKAVAKNGVPITPTNLLLISPNDLVTAEIYLSEWNSPPFDGGSGLVSGYQVTLAGKAGAQSSGACGYCNNEYVLPLGWDAPLEKDPCPCDNPCFSICHTTYGCVGPNHQPNQMASTNRSRSDYIFAGFDELGHPSPPTLDLHWFGDITTMDGQTASRCSGGASAGQSCIVNADCPGGTCNQNFQSYLGTLYLKVGSAVCGTFTFTFYADVNKTYIFSWQTPVPFLPMIQGLTLTVPTPCAPSWGACCTDDATSFHCETACLEDCQDPNQRFGGIGSTCAHLNPPCGCSGPAGACCTSDLGICTNNICPDDCMEQNQRFGGAGSTCATIDPPCVVSDPIPTLISPANCIIDARRPFPPGTPAQRQGITSQIWTFSQFPGATEDAPNDFTVRQVPPTTPPVPPTVASVTQGPGNTVTLNFSAPIQPNKWTCIKHIATNTERCIGYLPGDVNGDRTALPIDIIDLVDNLNGLRNPPYPKNMCDIDHSSVCSPADLVAEVDLLNGASGYPVQNGKTLPPCPSAP